MKTAILLQAPAGRIWELLSDFGLYREWNPLFRLGKGRAAAGAEVELTVRLPSIPPFAIKAKVVRAAPQSALCWRHVTASPLILRWDYGFELVQANPGEVRLVQSSRFGGVLGPLFALALGRSVREGMAELERAVARWGEKGNVRCLRC